MKPMNFEAVVNKCYNKMRAEFVQVVMNKFKASKLRQEDVEDIYQEIFIAIRENMLKGRIEENVSWNRYIMTIGLNMACKRYRTLAKTDSCFEEKDGEKEGNQVKAAVEVKNAEVAEEELPDWRNSEALEIQDRVLHELPENQMVLIEMHYFKGMKDEEIAQALPQYSSGKSVKVVRNRCYKVFRNRLQEELRKAGFEVKDEERVRA